MTTTHTINRAAFVDLLGCSIARWNWGCAPGSIKDLNQSGFSKIDFTLPVLDIIPSSPGRSFGKDVWSDISFRANNALSEYRNKRSIMISLRSCSTIAAALKVETLRDWTEFAHLNFEPLDLPLPKWPLKTYKEDWRDALHFFQKKVPEPFLPFEEAKVLIRKLELVTVQDFRNYLASGMATERMPKRPDNYYKEDWKGWASFLLSKFFTYDDAVEQIAAFNLQSEAGFRQLRSDGKCPEGIPSHPAIYYADDWKGWPHFLSRNSLPKSKEA